MQNLVCAVTLHTVQHRFNTDWDSGLVFYLCHKHAVHNWADVAGGTDWMGLPSPLQAAWQRQEGQTQSAHTGKQREPLAHQHNMAALQQGIKEIF